jgi:hypothetical protein
VNNLPRQLMIVIGRKFFGSSGLPLFLYIGFILPTSQISGISPITQEEILRCIKKLKNNKACGEDYVVKEYIKSTLDLFLPTYEKIFNAIFNSGEMPDIWLVGNIKPIYKNKGNPLDPKNFRPITIISCLGKLFT